MSNDEARLWRRLHELRDLAPVDSAKRRVEAAPPRDAMNIGGDVRLWQFLKLVVRQRDLAFDRAEDAEVPRREVRARNRARVQHGPFVRQVLAGREALRIVAGVRDLALGSRTEHAA